jgi:disulfide bond formation protein DsbB
MAFPKKYYLYIAWLQSIVAMMGSLFYSEIMQYAPCILCWYQRIVMYPLVVILAVGILRKDQKVYQYVLPFSILGMIIALYHTLLQQGFLPESAAPCVAGVSCVVKQVGYLGFITIPLMSFVSFVLISICMYLYKKGVSK